MFSVKKKKKKKKIPLSRRPGEALGRIRSVGQSVKGRGCRSPGDSERPSYLFIFIAMIICHLFGAAALSLVFGLMRG